MTLALAAARPALPDLRRMWSDAPAFAGLAVLLAIGLVPLYAAMALDLRNFQGASPWLKPVKFHFALSVYLISLAFFARYLPQGMRSRQPWRLFAAAVVLAVLAEVIWLSGAAMLNTASHFNTDVPFLTLIYPVMGVLAVLLTSASLVMGVAIWRNTATGLSPALNLGLALGLILTFVLTVIVAGTMSSGTGHLVGTPVTGATLPVMGWSREVGDLRSAHFLATHAMHAVPLAGFTGSRAVVLLAGLGYSGLVLASFLQALAGQPLI